MHICAASGPIRPRGRQGGEPGAAVRPRRQPRASGQADAEPLRARGLGAASPGPCCGCSRPALGRIGDPDRLRRRVPAARPGAWPRPGRRCCWCRPATDSLRGYWRVRIGATARALENQCVVVHAVTVGEADWLPPAARSTGAAGGLRAAGRRLSRGRGDRGRQGRRGRLGAWRGVARGGAAGARPTGRVLTLFDWPRQRGARRSRRWGWAVVSGRRAPGSRPRAPRGAPSRRRPGAGP